MNTAGAVLMSNTAITGPSTNWDGGQGLFSVDFASGGGFGGATVKLQYMGPAGNWYDAGAGTTLTAGGGGLFYLPPGQIRAAVVGGPPTGISAVVARIPS